GDGDTAVEHGVIHVARRDVRKRQHGKALIVTAEFKALHGAEHVAGNVAVREHGALGGAGSTGGVDDGGEIFTANSAGDGVECGVRLGRAGLHELAHGDCGGDAGVIHHHNLF